MRDLEQSRFASIVTLIGGIWIALSPIWFSMTGGQEASVITTGVAVGIISLVQLGWKNALPSWLNMVGAAWLFISTFIYMASTAARWDQAIVAIILFVVAIWDGAEIAHYNQHRHVGAM